MPPRRNVEGQNAQGNDVPTNVELAQGLQQLTQLTQALGNALLQNQNGNDVAKSVAARHPPNFLGQEDPIIMEDWIRTFDKLFDAVNCPMEHRVDTAALTEGGPPLSLPATLHRRQEGGRTMSPPPLPLLHADRSFLPQPRTTAESQGGSLLIAIR
nr:uncharacterized protein LOC109183675 [Ipomoea trifida]